MVKLVMDMNAMAKAAHDNAVAHGWWESGRGADEAHVLIHSEISEALEAYRDGKMDATFGPDGKPEGFASEIADVIIRAWDWMAHFDLAVDFPGKPMILVAVEKRAAFVPEVGGKINGDPKNILFWLNSMHCYVAQASIEAFSHYPRVEPCSAQASHIMDLIACALEFCLRFDIQIDEAIRLKMAYNETRPYKHGGKKV